MRRAEASFQSSLHYSSELRQNMSNGLSDLKDVLGLSKQTEQTLDGVSSVIGAISSVWGDFNTAKSILETLGLFPQSDQVSQIRQAIDKLWQEFQAVIAALDQEGSMRAVDHFRSMAENELQNLSEYAPENPLDTNNPSYPQWTDSMVTGVLDNTSEPVIELGKSSYWLRVFVPELVYKDPTRIQWPLVPPASGLIFDYRLTLPAYLEVISIRLTILLAVVKNYVEYSKTELNAMATTLEGYFNQIRSAIIEIGPPVREGGVPDPSYPGEPYTTGMWQQYGAPVGAFEFYSTFHLVDSWPAGEYPLSGPSSDPTAFGKFLVRYLVRTLRRWKQVFYSIGLGATAATLIKLKAIAGISPATIRPVDDHWTYHWTGDWSVRELAQRLAQTSGPALPPGVPQQADGTYPPITWPISLKQVLQALQTFNPQPYTSLRLALAQ